MHDLLTKATVNIVFLHLSVGKHLTSHIHPTPNEIFKNGVYFIAEEFVVGKGLFVSAIHLHGGRCFNYKRYVSCGHFPRYLGE